MISIQQHQVLNAKYADETSNTALVQVFGEARWEPGSFRWMDYARYTIEQARQIVNGKNIAEPGKWRVVDWITREEINLESEIPPVVKTFNLRLKLVSIEGAAVQARQAIINEDEGDLKLYVADLERLIGQVKEFVDSM